jgi:hypothetical protein
MPDFIAETLKTILAFGTRAVGSPAEKACAEYLAGVFQKQNLTVSREEFHASAFPLFLMNKILPAISLLVLALVAGVFFQHPGLCILLLLAPPAMLFGTSQNAFTRFAKIFDLGSGSTTCNILARTEPSLAINPNAPTIIISAHYDTKSHSQPSVSRFLCILIPLILYAILALLALLTLWHLATIPKPAVLTLILIAGLCNLQYMFNITANQSPGAMDNASGLAILLGLSRLLPPQMSDKAHLIFLATGAEEMGLIGAFRFLQAHRTQLDPARTLLVNFDCLGTGGTVSMVGPPRLKSAGLVDRARNLLAQQGFQTRFFSLMIGAGMDHIPFAQNGFSAMSFTQTTLEAARRMHSPNDRLEFLYTDELATLTQTFAKFIQTLP